MAKRKRRPARTKRTLRRKLIVTVLRAMDAYYGAHDVCAGDVADLLAAAMVAKFGQQWAVRERGTNG